MQRALLPDTAHPEPPWGRLWLGLCKAQHHLQRPPQKALVTLAGPHGVSIKWSPSLLRLPLHCMWREGAITTSMLGCRGDLEQNLPPEVAWQSTALP